MFRFINNFQVKAFKMESELNWNDSLTNLTVFSNTSDYELYEWTSADKVARKLQIIIRPILLVIGTTGNGLAFYIMRRTTLKDLSSCFYMSILALADTSKC